MHLWQGTHLETGLGQNISSSLWSAGLLQDDASGSGEAGSGNAAIVQAHLDFLHAGAELIGSCKYVQPACGAHVSLLIPSAATRLRTRRSHASAWVRPRRSA